jgi:hypothetical protein
MRLTRPRDDLHIALAGVVLLLFEAEGDRHLFQRSGQRKGQRAGHQTPVARDLGNRPPMARAHDIGLYEPFERVIERGNNPIRIACGFNEFGRDRIAGNPEFDLAIVDRIGAA